MSVLQLLLIPQLHQILLIYVYTLSPCASGIYISAKSLAAVVSRHTVVCRAAQEAGVPPVSILTGRKKTQFSHLCSSVIPYPIGTKFARNVPPS